MAVRAKSDNGKVFAFIFPMESGHINPSFSIARTLIKLGHRVHYLARPQLRAAIEDTGATFHAEIEEEPELYEGRQPSRYALTMLQPEYHLQQEPLLLASAKLRELVLELQLPGVLRWLRRINGTTVVYCPMMCREAAWAARIHGIPSVALLTTAGPGSMEHAFAEMLKDCGCTAELMASEAAVFAPRLSAAERLSARYGMEINCLHLRPAGRLQALAG